MSLRFSFGAVSIGDLPPPSRLDRLAAHFQRHFANAQEPELAAWGAKHSWRLLGTGESRAVFGVGGAVVKFAFSSYGADANRWEARVWNGAPELRPWLVPVRAVSSTGSWLVMDYAPPSVGAELPDAVAERLWDYGVMDIGGPKIRHLTRDFLKNLTADGRVLDYGRVLPAKWAAATGQVTW